MKKEYAVNRSDADDEETVTDFTSPVGLKSFHFEPAIVTFSNKRAASTTVASSSLGFHLLL